MNKEQIKQILNNRMMGAIKANDNGEKPNQSHIDGHFFIAEFEIEKLAEELSNIK